MAEHVQDCRSKEGQTTGLVDSVIFIVRAAMEGDMSHPDVQGALADLYQDPPFQAFLATAEAASAAYAAAQKVISN